MLKNFQQTKKIFKAGMRRILSDDKAISGELAEAAFPAYTHPNPIIDRIFWKRIERSVQEVINSSATHVLDFGCGSGISSFLLASENVHVVVTDTHLISLRKMQRIINFPDTIEVVEPEKLGESRFDHKFDFILALDVLEHVDNLPGIIKEFQRLLRPGGTVIVSGPTENRLYKMGRKLAGQEFTGTYHKTDVHKIESVFKDKGWQTTRVASFPSLLPLFIIFRASYTA